MGLFEFAMILSAVVALYNIQQIKMILKDKGYPVTVNEAEAARKEKAEGMVVVKFVVQKNGKISKISTVNQGEPAREDFVKEAIRVIKSMPDWVPAEQDGKKVHCEMALPVKFKLG